MIYILICIAALLLCFAAGFGIAKMITHKKNKNGIGQKVVLTFVIGIVLMLILCLGYLSISHKAEQRAMDALKGNTSVAVTAVSGGYFFDGPGNQTALIFYPGAKVECEAYAPLMLQIAEKRIDCFLIDMPFNFALFGENNAEKFMDEYRYKNWIMAGHSMGGMMAANYTANHSDRISGLVVLASYPTKAIANDIKFFSIYGSEDGCLNREEYEKGKTNWPDEAMEQVIEGANHAQFGDYGKQQMDGEALISVEEQQSKTANTIYNWMKECINAPWE